MFHFYGLRTKHCRRLLESDCIGADDIMFDEKGECYINGIRMVEEAKEQFAYLDGFLYPGIDRKENESISLWERMITFFKKTHGLPFRGQLIRW